MPTAQDNQLNSVARVVINLSLDRRFDYRVPEHLRHQIKIGSAVYVPFGSGRGTRMGYVVALSDRSTHPHLKEIERIHGQREQIPAKLLRLAKWISDYYCCAHEQAVRAMLPGPVRGRKISCKLQKHLRLADGIDLAEILPELEKRAPRQVDVVQELVRLKHCSLSFLKRETGVSDSVVKSLQEKNIIVVEERAMARDPFADDIILATQHLQLSRHQEQALAVIKKNISAESPGTILLHGVTGSGKTEVYLQAIQHCLQYDKETIVLVPEIALTPQTVERFRGRFGNEVSVLHSGLSDGERFDEWTKINEGRTKITVGARSALFAPFRNLGLIVVDEEHENTYKQDEAPRYHARDVAVMRGRLENCTVVLGSATPSLESYHNCHCGKYILTELPERVDARNMPYTELVDMRAEAALRGRPQILSRRLEDLVRGRLSVGEQVILFLNRRGYATQMLCTKCGYVGTCDDCSTAYTYHRQAQQLCCHLCGKILRAPARCPQCRDPEIRYTGLGTEKVESVVAALFPKATVVRMDSDTMTGKNAHRKTLDAFRAGRVHILIGTQMIAKGLHFPNVTLVGVIFADLGLHLPDFRAGERTFQLLTQVAGRAGRGEVPGHVVVQSYTPYHPALQHALAHDFGSFYKEEIEVRQALDFPPATHMILIHFRSEIQARAEQEALAFAAKIKPKLTPDVQVAGPLPAPIAKVRKYFRYQIALRGGRTLALIKLVRALVISGKSSPKDVDIHADVDPQSML